MKAVVLAAGMGTRLLDRTRDLPKALVAVNRRPLIDRVLDYVQGSGINEVCVVGGFCAGLLQERLGSRTGVTFATNTEYRRGSVLTLNAARPFLNGDTLLMNVDHLYPRALLRTFLTMPQKSDAPTGFVDFDRPLFADDMKVWHDSEKRITQISKTLTEFQAGYIGTTFIPGAFLQEYLRALDEVIAGSGGMSNVEAVLQRLADQGHKPHVFDASGVRWLEVDNQEDLANAERILNNFPNFLE